MAQATLQPAVVRRALVITLGNRLNGIALALSSSDQPIAEKELFSNLLRDLSITDARIKMPGIIPTKTE